MSDFEPSGPSLSAEGHQSDVPDAFTGSATTFDPLDALRKHAEQVMSISDVTRGTEDSPLRIRGELRIPAHKAFAQLRPRFEELGYTPQLKREDGQDVLQVLPGVFGQEERSIPWAAIGLLIATVLSVFFVGLQNELYVPVWTAIRYVVTGSAPGVAHPELLPSGAEFRQAFITGALYTLSLLGILGAHEMGHYIMARRHKVHTSPPFFIPLPFNILGTLGAVIAMREPAPNRRVQFDIGIAGPLAGLVIAVPLLFVGLMLSEVGTTQEFLSRLPDAVSTGVIHEGNSLAYLAAKYIVFGQVLPQGNVDVWIHPIAFAAWAGLLVTALNLLPIGQLDGGHVLYGLFGDTADKVRWPVIGVLIALAAAGTLTDMGLVNLPFGWSGWWIWVAMLVLLIRNHAPVLDEITELDPTRKAFGVLALIIFILIFTPRPLVFDPEPLAALLRTFM